MEVELCSYSLCYMKHFQIKDVVLTQSAVHSSFFSGQNRPVQLVVILLSSKVSCCWPQSTVVLPCRSLTLLKDIWAEVQHQSWFGAEPGERWNLLCPNVVTSVLYILQQLHTVYFAQNNIGALLHWYTGKKMHFDSKRWQEYVRWVYLLSASDSAITNADVCIVQFSFVMLFHFLFLNVSS